MAEKMTRMALISDLTVKCENLAKDEYLDVALWIAFEFGGPF